MKNYASIKLFKKSHLLLNYLHKLTHFECRFSHLSHIKQTLIVLAHENISPLCPRTSKSSSMTPPWLPSEFPVIRKKFHIKSIFQDLILKISWNSYFQYLFKLYGIFFNIVILCKNFHVCVIKLPPSPNIWEVFHY